MKACGLEPWIAAQHMQDDASNNSENLVDGSTAAGGAAGSERGNAQSSLPSSSAASAAASAAGAAGPGGQPSVRLSSSPSCYGCDARFSMLKRR